MLQQLTGLPRKVSDSVLSFLIWSFRTFKEVYSSPAVVNGVVYVGSESGKMYAFGLPRGLVKQPPKRPDPKTLRPDFNLKPVSAIE